MKIAAGINAPPSTNAIYKSILQLSMSCQNVKPSCPWGSVNNVRVSIAQKSLSNVIAKWCPPTL